jgi:hypothetical protein
MKGLSMRTNSQFLLLIFLAFGSAPSVPKPDDILLDPYADPGIQLANHRIDASRLSISGKVAAHERIFYVLDFSRALDRYIHVLEWDLSSNNDSIASYSTASTIPGDSGRHPSIAAPITSGLWNAVEQSMNIKPQLKDVQAKLDSAKALEAKFRKAQDKFELFADSTATFQMASAAFNDWKQQVDPLLTDAGEFLDRTLPTFQNR